jgi:hypothetical protein
MPFDIEGHGWELKVTRLGLQRSAGESVRTYGAYQVFIDGEAASTLSGHAHVRIHEGRYSLSTQFGEHYCTVGFTDGPTHPMPGFLLLGTEIRSAVLVHPGHPPDLYLSSIGCFNPTKPLKADQKMDFVESRARVIAMIDSLRQHDPAAFATDKIGRNTAIANAFMVVDGEPMIV